MKKAILIAVVIMTATAMAAQDHAACFSEKYETYNFVSGKTSFRLNCSGQQVLLSKDNDFGRHYEVMLHLTSGKHENGLQGVIHKDKHNQISAIRSTSRATYHYYWDDNTITEYTLTDGYVVNYAGCEKEQFRNDSTTDFGGLFYLARAGVPYDEIKARTLLDRHGNLKITDVSCQEDSRCSSYDITIEKGYYIKLRFRNDGNRTPEYISLNIPGLKTTGTLVETHKRF